MSGPAASRATRRHRTRRPIAADESGASAIEFAMLAPVFCLILVGAIDFGSALFAKFNLDGAVSAAANLAVLNAGSVNSSGGPTLAVNLANVVASGHAANWANASIVVNNGPSATLSNGAITSGGTAANADNSYCPTRSGNTISWGGSMTAGTACASGGIAGRFVVITATRAYSPIFSSYSIVSSKTITAMTVVETQ